MCLCRQNISSNQDTLTKIWIIDYYGKKFIAYDTGIVQYSSMILLIQLVPSYCNATFPKFYVSKQILEEMVKIPEVVRQLQAYRWKICHYVK